MMRPTKTADFRGFSLIKLAVTRLWRVYKLIWSRMTKMIIFGRLNESVIGAGVDVSEAPAIVTTDRI